jgi:hypothetical protein
MHYFVGTHNASDTINTLLLKWHSSLEDCACCWRSELVQVVLLVKVTLQLTVSQSLCQGIEPILGLVTRYYFLSEGCFLKFAVLSFWGALSDKRSGLTVLFMLTFDCKENMKTFFGINRIQGATVKIEPLRKPNLIPQCKWCQLHGHTQKYYQRQQDVLNVQVNT